MWSAIFRVHRVMHSAPQKTLGNLIDHTPWHVAGLFIGEDMTEFTHTLRHYCRNPRCRSKLPAPVANEREAFCCRGCYSAFYRTRCRCCEQTIEQPARGQRIICKKTKCKSAWKGGLGFGRYAGSSKNP